MELIIEELDSKLIGKKLGQNLYNSKGSLLLRKGAEIEMLHFAHLKSLGYQSVYVLNGNSADLDQDGEIISGHLRAKGPHELKGIFRKLLTDDRRQIATAKKEVFVLAENILKSVNLKKHEGSKILDLKRQGDYLCQHSINVAAYSILIGTCLSYHQLKLSDLAVAALLHDFGMLFIDESLLNKSTALTESESELIKEHTVKGFQHLGRNCSFKGLVTVVALQHHERYDGLGYPKGLVGEEPHEFSRIVALANFFDAYTSDRPYRRMHTIDAALQVIQDEVGTAFDPNLVQHFLKYF
ncbi:MAG: HD-GYP domain-containing protein [bacterium]